MSDWKKATTSGVEWKPEEEKEIMGVLTEVKHDVGKFGSTLATLENETRGKIAVWANTMLADLIKEVPIGNEVKITFNGMVKAKSGTGEYKSYSVDYREGPMKKAGAEVGGPGF